MACMEVWGGSHATDAAVTLSGLDAWVYARPYAQADAGGDVYYVSACATGRINRLLVADVAGHGEKVQSVALQLRDLMRRYVNYLDQSKFVVSMNHHFVECSAAGCFATAVVTTFFASTRTLSVCNAGHPPPQLWRARTREWSLLDRATPGAAAPAGNIPLGIADYDDCPHFDLELEVGDLVLVYTDSLIEARDADGEMLAPEGLLKLVRQVLPDPQPPTLIVTLLKAIDERTDKGLDADDVTLLLLRANGTGRGVALHRSFLAPFRVLGSVGRALAGRGPMSLPDWNLPNVGGAILPALGRLWRKRTRPS
jgi:serine phosphatase RsbU (regulator of sigma subunit)